MRRYSRITRNRTKRNVVLAFHNNLDLIRYCYPVFFTTKSKALYFVSFYAHDEKFFYVIKNFKIFKY